MMLGNAIARQGFRLARHAGTRGLHSAASSVIGVPRWVVMARKGGKRKERSREEREEAVDLDRCACCCMLLHITFNSSPCCSITCGYAMDTALVEAQQQSRHCQLAAELDAVAAARLVM
jgi:hypothetical protein